ncbi:Ppx/GppA family phosphatase [bacterium]|nr:Ppx/GppA family phosphatase [bacterium]
MKRLASIDIGTNTALLLIADITDEFDIQPLHREERIVRLGEGVDQQRRLKQEAIGRTLDAIDAYLTKARELEAQDVVVSGTSAVRDAANRSDLLAQIKQRFGMDMRVLSGQQEAVLTYFGALSNKTQLDDSILLIDIGGGSTECILGDRFAIKRSLSLDIGSVRMTERYIKHDPVARKEFDTMRNVVKQTLRNRLDGWVGSAQYLVGVAGTITTLAAMDLAMESYDADKIENYVLTRSVVADSLQCLIKSDLTDRTAMPGLRPERADVILAGATILAEILDYFEFQKLTVSDRGLRFGLLLESAGKRLM